MQEVNSLEKPSRSRNTKEEILLTALRLFSINGYESVSVRDIAGKLNISQAALYRHYKNKQDIFDCIVRHMSEDYQKKMIELQIPEGNFKELAKQYETIPDELIMKISLGQFAYWTQNEYASCFRKMLSIEQYRNKQMADLYQFHLGTGVISYMSSLFREMIKSGFFRKENPEQCALEFYAPFYILITLYDGTKDKERVEKMMYDHIATFMNDHKITLDKK